jgi:hypothetical protein
LLVAAVLATQAVVAELAELAALGVLAAQAASDVFQSVMQLTVTAAQVAQVQLAGTIWA